MDSNTPGLDPITRQQLKDIETERRIKALETRLELIKLNLSDRLAELQKSVSNLILKVKALETQPDTKLSQIKKKLFK